MASPNPLDYIKLGTDVLGGLFGGLAGGQDAKAQQGLQKRGIKASEEMGRRQAALAEGQQASDYERTLSMAPLRDRVLYNLTQRAGMPSPAFRPTDMFNQATSMAVPQLGGIDRDALAARTGAYRPGMGGVNTAVMQRAMEVLGYRPDGSYMSPTFRHDIRSGGVNPYGPAAHGYSPEDRHDFASGQSLIQRGGSMFTPDSPSTDPGFFGPQGIVDPRMMQNPIIMDLLRRGGRA